MLGRLCVHVCVRVCVFMCVRVHVCVSLSLSLIERAYLVVDAIRLQRRVNFLFDLQQCTVCNLTKVISYWEASKSTPVDIRHV